MYQKLYNFLNLQDKKEIKADLIIGFGHFDLRIPEQCATLYNNGEAPLILFTGGIGAGSGDFKNPEAIEFYNYTKEKYPHISKNFIFIESESTNTGENIKNSIKLLQDKGIFDSIQSIILVATPVRQLRVCLTVKKILPKIKLINKPPISTFEFDAQMNTEKGIDFKKLLLGELHRIKTYPKKGYICKTTILNQLKSVLP